MFDDTRLRSSLMRLREQHENYRQDNPARSRLDREAIAESVVRRFGTCYECLWRALNCYMFESFGNSQIPNSPKLTFQLANEYRLLPTPVEQWLRYAEARVDTSHDCDSSKVRDCLVLVQDFIVDATNLHETISGKAVP